MAGTLRLARHLPALAAALGAAATLARTSALDAQAASVVGVVRDSLARAALAGATVQLVPADAHDAAGWVAFADAEGRFRLDSVAAGRYLIGFLHARLDTLGIEPPTRVLDVRPGTREVRADLALPGARALASALCGMLPDSTGVLFGQVLDAERGGPAAGGEVVVRWGELVLDRVSGVRRAIEERRGPVGPGGRYAVCGVPAGDAVGVQAIAPAGPIGQIGQGRADSAASGEVEVRLPPEAPLLYRNLLVAESARADEASPSTAPATAPAVTWRRGTAALAGRVRGPDGRPLAGARVVVRLTAATGVPISIVGVDSVSDAVAVTDAAGAYRLDRLPAGTRATSVFALGYTPARGVVDLQARRVTTADFTAGPRVTTLAGVRVYAAPLNPMSEFARRRGKGPGYYYDADAIARRLPHVVADALVGLPGLQVRTMRNGRPVMRGRRGGLMDCAAPSLFVDGMPVLDDTAGLDFYVSVSQIGGVEVYPDGMLAPPQYRGCAVVLIWTKWALQ